MLSCRLLLLSSFFFSLSLFLSGLLLSSFLFSLSLFFSGFLLSRIIVRLWCCLWCSWLWCSRLWCSLLRWCWLCWCRLFRNYCFFFLVIRIDYRHLLTKYRNLIGGHFVLAVILLRDLALFNLAVIPDEDLRDTALYRARAGDGLRADDADIVIEHVLIIPSILKCQDAVTRCDGDGIFTDCDDRLVWEQLYAAIPVLILDCDCGDLAILCINEERLAHAELAAFGDADYRQADDLYAFLHVQIPPIGNR